MRRAGRKVYSGVRVFCLALTLCALGLPAASAAQTLTLTSNGSTTLPVIISWDDYAKRTFGDPWDMNQRTDIGWLTWGIDQPANGLTGKRVENGRFTATPTNSDPNFFLLDSWFTGASKIGKNGGQYPIDLSRYTMLVLKVKMATTVLNQAGTVNVDGATVTAQTFAQVGIPQMSVFWSRDSIGYNPTNTPLGGSIGLGFRCNVDISCPDVPGTPEVEGGISFSPGPPAGGQETNRAFSAMAKSMEGGRYVMHTVQLNDFSSTSAYTHLKSRSDAVKWRNFGGANTNETWTGMADSFRIDPVSVANLGGIDVDFVRLLAPDTTNSTPLVISWAGGAHSRYDVVVSTDQTCDDDPGTAGAQYTVVAYSQQSGLPFLPQTLPAGEYYIGLRDQMCGVMETVNANPQYCDTQFIGLQSSAVRVCSTTPIRVIDAPAVTFTSPRPDGSADEFATVQLGNAWDFLTLGDVDLSGGLVGATVGTIPAERPSGLSLGNLRAYTATSTPAGSGNVGDPLVYPFYLTGRGAWNRIDAQRYRLLTFELGIDKVRDLRLGSIARVVWHIAGEGGTSPINGVFASLQNVSMDILLRHMARGTTTVDTTSARHVIDRFQADLMDHVMLPLEGDANGSHSRTGWSNTCTVASGSTSPATGLGGGLVSTCVGTTPTTDPFGLSRVGIDAFRLDPHEFAGPTTFHLAGIILAAHERVANHFTISWTTENPNPNVDGLGGLNPGNNANWTVRLYGVPVSPTSPMTPISRTCSAATSGVIGDFPLSAGTAIWGGTFQSGPGRGAINGGELVFVCAGVIPPGGTTPLEFAFSQWPVVYGTSAHMLAPRLFLDKSALRFTGIRTLTGLSAVTPAQTVTVTQVGSGTVPWTVDVRDSNGQAVNYVQVSPASGSGARTFAVSVVASDSLPREFTGLSADIGLVIRLTAAGAENTPQYVNMTLALYREGTIATARAFGQVDTPVHYTGAATDGDPLPCAAAAGTPDTSDDCVSGSIAVTGWALDDIGVSQVQIFRQCTATEAGASPSPCQLVEDHNVVFVGTASFISGARPDVEAAFPGYPNAHRAGWGFLVLTNVLPAIGAGTPAGGQGRFDFYLFAQDAEGGRTLLGRTTADSTPTRIYANNTAAAAPFGAIDNPAQGEIISGTCNNFGWVLTPPSGVEAEMDINGGGMMVFVDGSPVGMPTYNLCRGTNAIGGMAPPGVNCNDDISTLFASGGYRNLLPGRGAIGLLTFNTATLSNGLHSIAWGVTDSRGRSSGIGSRFITVLNGAGDGWADATAAFHNLVGQEVGRWTSDLTNLGEAPGDVAVRLGYDLTSPFRRAAAASNRARVVSASEMDRVELALPMPLSDAAWDGYLVRNGRLYPLPPGTALNPASGAFTWQGVPGWVGTHDLLFVRQNINGTRERMPVSVSFGTVTVAPRAFATGAAIVAEPAPPAGGARR